MVGRTRHRYNIVVLTRELGEQKQFILSDFDSICNRAQNSGSILFYIEIVTNDLK